MITCDIGKRDSKTSVCEMQKCGNTFKVTRVLLISKYMVKKYGFVKAVERKYKIKLM